MNAPPPLQDSAEDDARWFRDNRTRNYRFRHFVADKLPFTPVVPPGRQAPAFQQAVRAIIDGDHRCNGAPVGRRDTGLLTKSSTGQVPAALLGEENDVYPIVASLNAQWRIIACKNSIQWILQKRRGGPNHWRGRSYCCTRQALVRCVGERAGGITADALVILQRLPERIGGSP